MSLFRYEAVDKRGKVVRGVMNAAGEQQVTQKLQAMGYSARGVYAAGGSGQAQSSKTGGPVAARPRMRTSGKGMQMVTLPKGLPVSIQSKVSAPTLAVFFRQLATLVRSGRPLVQSTSDLVVRDARLRGVLPSLQEHVQSGKSLSSALADYPDVFPVHTIASIWCGELGGRLDVVLDEVAADLEQEASEIRYAKFGRILGKLSLLALVFALPAANLVDLLLPSFQRTMDKSEPTWQDSLRYIFENYMANMFWKSAIVAIGIIAFWIVFGYVKRVPMIRRLIDGFVLHVPIWGTLQRYRSLARFTHVLDSLYAAGISPGKAWEAASLTPRNTAIAEKLKLTQTSNPSIGVAGLLAASGVFDQEDVGMVSVGEKSGQVPEMLARISSTYADKAQAQRSTGRSWSTSLLIFFSIVFTGIILVEMVASYLGLAIKAADMVGK